MQRAVSISLGSSRRNQRIETTLLGRRIQLERIGVDGDLEHARRLFKEMDGSVDAFGLGGADLRLWVADRYYSVHSVSKLVQGIRTPVVDGGTIRRVVEAQIATHLEAMLPAGTLEPKRAFFCVCVGRYDMACGFYVAGYDATYGDLGFGLGLPIPIRSLLTVRRLARLLMPIMGRLPFHWVYPTGDEQDQIRPKFEDWYQSASVIADDFHYIKQHLPDRLDAKVVVTNTTTVDDVEMLRQRGVAYLCTTTPRLEGRTFGTNVMEAALTAIAGLGRPLTTDELSRMLPDGSSHPTVLALNP